MDTGLCSRIGGLVLAVVSASIIAHVIPGSPAHAAEGFGAATAGGRGRAVVRVRNLNSSGPGSLREALSAGYRTIVFDVGGSIVLDEALYVRGPFVTIDGSTAPRPGITLVGRGLAIRGDRGAHNVIVRHLRIRDSDLDNLQIAGASNVLIENVSVSGAGDGNLDITEGARDVTVAWSIIADPASRKSMLIKYNTGRVTLHHSLFVDSESRNPQASINDAGTPGTDTTLDMRNSVVWGWGPGYGTLIHHGARANVVGNYYASPVSAAFDQPEALNVCSGSPTCLGGDPAARARGYVAGNVDGDGLTATINRQNTEAVPFPAPPVNTTTACAALQDVLDGAGARPLDARDAAYVARVTRVGCVDERLATTTVLTSSRAPSTDGDKVTFTATVSAVDSAVTPRGRLTIYDNGAVLKALVLGGGAASYASTTLSPGVHSLVAVYDGDSALAGSTSPIFVQKVLGSSRLPARNKSSLGLKVALAPCCDTPVLAGAAGLITRKESEDKNVVLSDVLRGSLTVPVPLAGIVDARTARTTDVRLVFSRNAIRYAECRLSSSGVSTPVPGGPAVALYKLAVVLAPDAGGTLALTESNGYCDVDLATGGIQRGVPDAVYGDRVTLTIGPDDARFSVLESRFVKD